MQSGLDLTVYRNGGVPPYTYSWNNGDTTQMININSNGNYLWLYMIRMDRIFSRF